ncbi:MAG: DMT family transporter [Burkholderiales bacterium]|jgi:drug/metabolite transporter (DMT)-like permease|nr:DMT family transporter [Burkholderiales bacterium]
MHALWMVLAAFLFASMGVCVKLGSAYFHPAEMIFWRGIIGMALLWALARSQGATLATAHPGKHAWRSFVGVVSLGTWFYAITQLPLATAMTLNYMSSVWIAAFFVAGSLWAWRAAAKGQRPALQAPLVMAVLAGFAGVVMMLRPSIGQTPQQLLGASLGMLSGMTAAMAYMQVTHLSRMGEPESRTVFYFALGSALAGGAVTLAIGHSAWPGWAGLWLLPIGVLAALGQLCMTRAYGSAHSAKGTLVVASLQYSGIVFASLYSVLLFGDRIPALGWLGMALIVGSGILATVLRARSTRNLA